MTKTLTNAEILEYYKQHFPEVELHISEDDFIPRENDYCLFSGEATVENIEAVNEMWCEAVKRYGQRLRSGVREESGILWSKGIAIPWVRVNEKGVSNWATWYGCSVQPRPFKGKKKESVYTIRRWRR